MSLSSILTVPTFLLAISINIVMLVLRRVAELIWPTLASHTPRSLWENIWGRLLLPTMPALMGAFFCAFVPPAADGLLSGFAYPAVVLGIWSRILYGAGTGWFSAYLYTVFKFLLKKEWNIDVPFPGDSAKPAPTSEAMKPVAVTLQTPPKDKS